MTNSSESLPSTAAEWVARLAAEPLSKTNQTALEEWLEADARNKADFALVRMTWGMSNKLDSSEVAKRELRSLYESYGTRTLADSLVSPQVAVRSRPWLRAAAIAATIAVTVGAYVQYNSLTLSRDSASTERAVIVTAIDQISHHTLPDGSKLTLGADTSLRVEFTKERRQVVLERGEAFFDVLRNPSRPFVVAAGTRSVVVTGTKFDVDYNSADGPVQVAVVEGRVNVSNTGNKEDKSQAVSLTAGDVIRFPHTGEAVRMKMPATLATSWMERRLYFEQATLREAMVEINRYSRKRLILADAKLAQLPISGSFRAGDLETVLFSLRTLYNISAADLGDAWLLSTPGNGVLNSEQNTKTGTEIAPRPTRPSSTR